MPKGVRGGNQFPNSYNCNVSRCSKENEAKIINEWLSNGYNMTQAVLKVFPHYKKQSARTLGMMIYKKNRVLIDRIRNETEETVSAMLEAQVISMQERRVLLSEIIQDDEIPINDRLSSIKILNKMDGIGTTTTTTNITNNTLNLSLEERKKVVAQEMKKLIERDHETIED